jgi:hypothetical protein
MQKTNKLMLTIVNTSQGKVTTFVYKQQSIGEHIKLLKLCIKFLDQNEFLSFFNMN